MQLTENFSLHEFDCNDGTPVPDALLGNVEALAGQLQILRNHLGERIMISSAYRHQAYNKKIGGKSNSYHLKAMAADITVKSRTPRQLKAIVEKLIEQKKLKFGGIGLYPGFLHVDIRRQAARW
jgi:uncharacterized protein YcbK (DUF882 family)